MQENGEAERNVNVEPLLTRAHLFLEDGEFEKADEYFERVLDADPQCARAYFGKYLAENKFKTENEIVTWVVEHFREKVDQLVKEPPTDVKKIAPVSLNAASRQSIDALKNKGIVSEAEIQRLLKFDAAYVSNLAAIDEVKRDCENPDVNQNYQKALRFASPSEKNDYTRHVEKVREEIENLRREMDNEEEATREVQNRYEKHLAERLKLLQGQEEKRLEEQERERESREWEEGLKKNKRLAWLIFFALISGIILLSYLIPIFTRILTYLGRLF